MNQQALHDALLRLPRAQLGIYPTPLHRLANYERLLGREGIFIKRDDMTGLGPGGNKVRSLEYILGEAIARGADAIIGAGPVQSNLCALLACACARLRLRCVLIHNGDKPQRPTGNLLLNSLLGVESIFVGNLTKYQRNDYMQEVARDLAASGSTPYIVENGATTGLGALGYVRAVVEMQQQREDAQLGVQTIFAPGGNGGVASGLIYGNAVLGYPFDLVIVSVEYGKARLKENIRGVIAQIEAATGIAFPGEIEDGCRILDDYMGGGWGQPTPQSDAAVLEFPRTEGIFLEPVYTSKPWVAMKDQLERGKVRGGACFLHTGGLSSLFGLYA